MTEHRAAGGETSASVGVLSDTHGLLRPEVVPALSGCDLLLHAGDVGKPEILTELNRLAPIRVVRGNVDHGDWADALPRTELLEVGSRLLYMIHDLADLDLDPAAAGIDAVLYGHSHRPSIEQRQGVLYLNPGSCGPRRFDLPVTLAKLTVGPVELRAEIVELLPTTER